MERAEHIRIANETADEYVTWGSAISDDGHLLRGCLHALMAIIDILDEQKETR